jgi:hypothetical protein
MVCGPKVKTLADRDAGPFTVTLAIAERVTLALAPVTVIAATAGSVDLVVGQVTVAEDPGWIEVGETVHGNPPPLTVSAIASAEPCARLVLTDMVAVFPATMFCVGGVSAIEKSLIGKPTALTGMLRTAVSALLAIWMVVDCVKGLVGVNVTDMVQEAPGAKGGVVQVLVCVNSLLLDETLVTVTEAVPKLVTVIVSGELDVPRSWPGPENVAGFGDAIRDPNKNGLKPASA